MSSKKLSRVYFRSKIAIFRAKPWFSTKITYFEHVLPLKRHGTCYFGVDLHCETKSNVIKTQCARIFVRNHWFSSQNRDFHAKVPNDSKLNLETFLVCMFGCLRPPEGATSENSVFHAKIMTILKMVPSSHLKFRILAVATSIDTGTPNNLSNVFLRQFRNFWVSHQKNIFEILSRKMVQCEGAKNKEILKKHIFAPSTFCTSQIVGKWLVESFQIQFATF